MSMCTLSVHDRLAQRTTWLRALSAFATAHDSADGELVILSLNDEIQVGVLYLLEHLAAEVDELRAEARSEGRPA